VWHNLLGIFQLAGLVVVVAQLPGQRRHALLALCKARLDDLTRLDQILVFDQLVGFVEKLVGDNQSGLQRRRLRGCRFVADDRLQLFKQWLDSINECQLFELGNGQIQNGFIVFQFGQRDFLGVVLLGQTDFGRSQFFKSETIVADGDALHAEHTVVQ